MADNQFALRSRCVAHFNTSFALLLHSCCHTLANVKVWYVSLNTHCVTSLSNCQSVSAILTFKMAAPHLLHVNTPARNGAVHHWLETNWKEKTLQTCRTHLNWIKIAGWAVGGGRWRRWIRAEASCTLRSAGVGGIHVDAKVINCPLDLWGIEQRDGSLTSKTKNVADYRLAASFYFSSRKRGLQKLKINS